MDQDQTETLTSREGGMSKMVESYTAQVPPITFLGLALGGIFLSALVAVFAKNKSWANFVGLWGPTAMLIGIYNKLVRIEGSDQFSRSLH